MGVFGWLISPLTAFGMAELMGFSGAMVLGAGGVGVSFWYAVIMGILSMVVMRGLYRNHNVTRRVGIVYDWVWLFFFCRSVVETVDDRAIVVLVFAFYNALLMALEKCIYCANSFDPAKGEGDHVIPAALGEFRDDTRFRGCCSDCNNWIGRSEEVLLRCGPEAFFRRVVNPAIPASRRRGRASISGARGNPAPLFTAEIGGIHALVRPSGTNSLRASGVDQLVIRDTDGVDHRFPLFPNMNAEAFRRKILGKIAPSTISTILLLYYSEGACGAYTDLVQAMFPISESTRLPDVPAGEHPVKGRVSIIVNDHYWRSIAKIAFHYYLSHTRRAVRGDEPGFNQIRNFITKGGDQRRFFRASHTRFRLPFDGQSGCGAASPAQWCHVLGADEQEQEVVAYVRLFAGPGCMPPAYHIVLGTLDSNIVGPLSLIYGHVYLYDEPQSAAGKAGQVMAATVAAYQYSVRP